MIAPIAELARGLRAGTLTSRALVEQCLHRAQDPAGEGRRTFLRVDAENARRAADAVDAARKAGREHRPWAGIPVSVKDLFDIAGQVTTSGSAVLKDAAPAQRDAAAVARLKAAGFVVVGRTNMTEFAYSGLGLNPHYGTPANTFERALRRIPGGSSSGAAIFVTDGMAAGALGTDTGGSCRIPAALNGIAGFKPTAASVPMEGAFPLSSSLDSVGPLAATARCCAILHSVLADAPAAADAQLGLAGLHLAVPQTVVLDGLDAHVAAAFSSALARLSGAGVCISELALRQFGELAGANVKGGLVAAEAFAAHHERMAQRGAEYDPRVKVRIEKGATQTVEDYAQLQAFRRQWIRSVTAEMEDVDLLVCPTVPTIAPAISALEHDDEYGRVNLAMLRNPTFANFLDGCAISIPCHEAGTAPVGLMLIGRHGDDARVLAAGQAIEALLAPRRA
ncbi:MAG TPA: amidase [Ramlibacter sp.]|uniref:amidase n=1 Tax=Ramlibacter sp. TaxID=1917967 RepID=UPI002D8034A3|nr:amidase [Ramlibacter sp.]HET8744678.1 amidase [Ramlibacter sp.]